MRIIRKKLIESGLNPVILNSRYLELPVISNLRPHRRWICVTTILPCMDISIPSFFLTGFSLVTARFKITGLPCSIENKRPTFSLTRRIIFRIFSSIWKAVAGLTTNRITQTDVKITRLALITVHADHITFTCTVSWHWFTLTWHSDCSFWVTGAGCTPIRIRGGEVEISHPATITFLALGVCFTVTLPIILLAIAYQIGFWSFWGTVTRFTTIPSKTVIAICTLITAKPSWAYFTVTLASGLITKGI